MEIYSFAIGIIIVVIIAIPIYWKQGKIEKAIKADFKKEFGIAGIVNGVTVMPYIPGGFGSYGRSEQTLVIFENGSRITIKGLHPEIENGQNWRIKYKGTDKWHRIKPLISKKLI